MDPGGVCRADGMPRIQCDHTSDALPNHRARKRDAGACGAACGFSFQAVGETKAGDVKERRWIRNPWPAFRPGGKETSRTSVDFCPWRPDSPDDARFSLHVLPPQCVSHESIL